MLQLLVLPFILTILILFYLDCRKPKNFPLGPKWLPIIGSALYLHKERTRTGMLCKAVQAISKNYPNNNDVIGFKVGKDKTVIAIGADSIKEMMNNEDLDGRPTGPFYQTRTWGKRRGLLLTDGEFWIEQRRFVVRHLKEFGFARRGMVEMIQNEAEHLLNDFKSMLSVEKGEAKITMQGAFNIYILNTLWTMMAGIRYNRDNLKLKELTRLLHELFTNIDMTGALFSHFPILRFIAPNFSGYNQFVDIHKTMHSFIGKEVENHKRKFKMENEPLDLMDVYLQVLQNPNRKSSFTEKQLLAICLDMFMAGSETTAKSLGFSMLYIIRNKNVQRQIQEEIDNVVGRNRLPILEDRANMPYCEAVILEGLRLFMAHTFGIPHRAMRDTTLGGFDIPKDTMVVACFSGMMLDPILWPDPKVFRPERFLDENRKVVIPSQYNPFGVGKHRCMGEMMARSNLFLFTTTLLQNFNFSIPIGHPLPSDEPLDGATPTVRQYTALVVNR